MLITFPTQAGGLEAVVSLQRGLSSWTIAFTGWTAAAQNANDLGYGAMFLGEAGHGAIVGLQQRVTAVTGIPAATWRFSLQHLSGKVPDGVALAFVDNITWPTPPATVQFLFGTPYTPALGEALAAVFEYNAGTVGGNFITAQIGTGLGLGIWGAPIGLVKGGGLWTQVDRLPMLCPIYADGYIPYGFLPADTITITQPSSASTPRYQGCRINTPIGLEITGVEVAIETAVGSDFAISIFRGGILQETIAVSQANLRSTGTLQAHFVPCTPFVSSPGVNYDFMLSGTAATPLTIFSYFTFATAAAAAAFWGPLAGVTSDGTTFTTQPTRVYPVVPVVTGVVT